MKIGLTRLDYPEVRCIKTSSLYEYKNLKGNNFLGYCKRMPIIKNIIDDFLYMPTFSINVDVYHAFNYICITKKKWVVSYETMVPRFLDVFDDIENHTYSKKIELYLTKISQKNCLALLPISQCTKNIQDKILENYPNLKKIITDKTFVLYPPQEIICNEVDVEEKNNDKLKFMFVGNDFYRKGGGEVIEAFEQLFISGKLNPNDVEIKLVGDICRKYNYAHGDFQHGDDYYKRIESILDKYPSIVIINKIDNNSVIELMKDCNVGILTSWADTFGYSVLEFQATGCPVISTNIRALPEINNNEVGWVIDLKKDKLGNIVISSYQDVIDVKSKIIDGLKCAVMDAISNKSNVIRKGVSSVRRIREFHDIDKYNEVLRKVYNSEI